jgi:hypothetical protein
MDPPADGAPAARLSTRVECKAEPSEPVCVQCTDDEKVSAPAMRLALALALASTTRVL